MTLTRKLISAGAGLSLVALGAFSYDYYVRLKSGHDEPLTVDNPKITIDFHKKGHPVRVDREGLSAVALRRDITRLQYAVAVFRNSGNTPVDLHVDFTRPVYLVDSRNQRITTSVRPSGTPGERDQIVFDFREAKQFGGCWLDPIFNRKCSVEEDDIHLLAVRYTHITDGEQYLCFDNGRPPGITGRCTPSANQSRAALTFCLTPEPDGGPSPGLSDCDRVK